MKPFIGISTCVRPPNDPKRSFNVAAEIQYIQQSYIQFVRLGGGLPILLPIIENSEEAAGIADRIDGVILTGGPEDVDPKLYGEENTHSKDVNEKRDASEIALVHEMRKRSKAILGICRGIQILNIALGGVNYQDIPTQVKNVLNHPLDKDNKEVFHNVSFTRKSVLTELFGNNEIRVNSSHHQAVKIPGTGLTILSTAADSVIEAVQCLIDRCSIGVQWHPERMLDNENQIGISRWFISQAAQE